MNMRMLICWCLLLLGALPVMGHDIGMMSLRFMELGGNRYQLEYIAQPGSPESEAPPILPEHLKWEKEPGLPGGLVRLVFGTDGKPLSIEDRIVLPWRVNGVMVEAFWRNGETARHFATPENGAISFRIGDLRAGTGSFKEAAKHYTRLGVEHVLSGWEHLMFLAALLLLVRGWKSRAAALATFVAGQTAALAIAIWWRFPVEAALVNAMVALTTAALALEIVCRKKGNSGFLSWNPWIPMFVFGTIHGLGFAHALSSLGLPKDELPTAIGFFDLGIQLGQLGLVFLWSMAATVLGKGFAIRLPAKWEIVPPYALGIHGTGLFLNSALALFM